MKQNPTTAIKELGIKGIFENLKGRAKTAGGFIWKYEGDILDSTNGKANKRSKYINRYKSSTF